MAPRLSFLLVLVSAVAFAALISPPSLAGGDERTLLVLDADEKTSVRSEMRKLLVSVSGILSALNANNPAGIEAAARESGMVMAGQVEVTLKEKLPPSFKKLGKSVHLGFDEIADAARDGANRDTMIDLLDRQMNRCITCHAAYGLR